AGRVDPERDGGRGAGPLCRRATSLVAGVAPADRGHGRHRLGPASPWKAVVLFVRLRLFPARRARRPGARTRIVTGADRARELCRRPAILSDYQLRRMAQTVQPGGTLVPAHVGRAGGVLHRGTAVLRLHAV